MDCFNFNGPLVTFSNSHNCSRVSQRGEEKFHPLPTQWKPIVAMYSEIKKKHVKKDIT